MPQFFKRRRHGYFKKALNLYKILKRREDLAHVLYLLGTSRPTFSDFALTPLKNLQEMNALFETETRPRFKWLSSYLVAETYRLLGQFELAKEFCQKSLNWCLTTVEAVKEIGIFWALINQPPPDGTDGQ